MASCWACSLEQAVQPLLHGCDHAAEEDRAKWLLQLVRRLALELVPCCATLCKSVRMDSA